MDSCASCVSASAYCVVLYCIVMYCIEPQYAAHISSGFSTFTCLPAAIAMQAHCTCACANHQSTDQSTLKVQVTSEPGAINKEGVGEVGLIEKI